MIELDTITKFEECIKKNAKVIIDFYATWCNPCKNIAPVLQEYADKNPDIVFVKVDVDANDDTAGVCNVDAMPTIIAFHNGVELSRFEGASLLKLADLVSKLQSA